MVLAMRLWPALVELLLYTCLNRRALEKTSSGVHDGMNLDFGGWDRNRTDVQGVAVLCITTLPPSRGDFAKAQILHE
jgi:hypothetical protein